MAISLQALCTGRREVKSDEIQANIAIAIAIAAKFAKIDLVDSLQNKVRGQTKRHFADAYLLYNDRYIYFLIGMINLRCNRTVTLDEQLND